MCPDARVSTKVYALGVSAIVSVFRTESLTGLELALQ